MRGWGRAGSRVAGQRGHDVHAARGRTAGLRFVVVAALMSIGAGFMPTVAAAVVTGANDAGYFETVDPIADASVRSDTPVTNFNDANLRVKAANPATRSYVQFQVGAPTKVRAAELWLYDGADPAPGGGVAVRRTGNGWTETGITWSTAPALQGTVAPVAQSAGKWVKFDVTPLISGSGLHTFALTGTGAGDKISTYASREGYPNRRPRLVLTVADYDRPVRVPGPARVALYGDSITAQYSATAVSVLQAQGYDVRARGLSATGLLDATECQGQRASAIVSQDDPDIVILEHIGNYAAYPPCNPNLVYESEAFYAEWQRAAQRVTDTFRSRGADVVWMLSPPVRPGSAREPSLLRINDIYRTIALGTPGVGVVDAFNAFGGKTFDPTLRHADGVHLNASGITAMASLVQRGVVDTTNGIAMPPPVLVTPSSLPAARAESDYTASLTATGGVAPHSWSVTSGSLPPGLTPTSSGTLSGTPTTPGTFSFTVQVADARVGRDSRSFTIAVAPPPVSVTTASLPGGMVAVPFAATLLSRGGVAPHSWTVTSGSLPAGLALSGVGEIAGTPTAWGTFEFTVQASDADVPTGSATISLALTIAPPPVKVTTASLPAGMVASQYATPLSASGGVPGYSWSLASGSLPPGLTLAGSGSITGAPTAAGTFTFTVRVVDSASPGDVSIRSLSIKVVPAALRITTASLPEARIGQAYSATLKAFGGTAPYRWSIVGGLPAGLDLDRKAGVISGVAKRAGTVTFTVQLQDAATPAGFVTKVFSITIR